LEPFQNETTAKVIQAALDDQHPLVRFAALGYFDGQITTLAQTIRESQLEAEQIAAAAQQMTLDNPQSSMFIRERVNQSLAQAAQASDALESLARPLAKLLDDPSRLVRTEAGRLLAAVPGKLLTAAQRASRKQAIAEYLAGLDVDNDWALSHLTRGLIYERSAVTRADYERAIDAYRLASRVEPDVVGPRSNLAELLERLAQQEPDAGKAQAMMLETRELRRIETGLLANEAKLLPDNASVQYRYGLSLYLIGEEEQALAALQRASELEPDSFDILLRLALLHKKRKEWQPAIATLERLLKLQPDNQMLQHVLRETHAEAAAAAKP
jgi:tetratricopeptide (TPR) repeat protein